MTQVPPSHLLKVVNKVYVTFAEVKRGVLLGLYNSIYVGVLPHGYLLTVMTPFFDMLQIADSLGFSVLSI